MAMKTVLPRVQFSWITGYSPRGLRDRLGHCRERIKLSKSQFVSPCVLQTPKKRDEETDVCDIMLKQNKLFSAQLYIHL